MKSVLSKNEEESMNWIDTSRMYKMKKADNQEVRVSLDRAVQEIGRNKKPETDLVDGDTMKKIQELSVGEGVQRPSFREPEKK